MSTKKHSKAGFAKGEHVYRAIVERYRAFHATWGKAWLDMAHSGTKAQMRTVRRDLKASLRLRRQLRLAAPRMLASGAMHSQRAVSFEQLAEDLLAVLDVVDPREVESFPEWLAGQLGIEVCPVSAGLTAIHGVGSIRHNDAKIMPGFPGFDDGHHHHLYLDVDAPARRRNALIAEMIAAYLFMHSTTPMSGSVFEQPSMRRVGRALAMPRALFEADLREARGSLAVMQKRWPGVMKSQISERILDVREVAAIERARVRGNDSRGAVGRAA